MSRLEDICLQLDALAKEATQWSAALNTQSRSMGQQAQQIARLMQQQNNHIGKQIAAQLQYASVKAAAAAALLNSVNQKSQRWIATTIAAGAASNGGVSVGSSDSGGASVSASSGGSAGGGFLNTESPHRMSPKETNARYKSGIEDIEAVIDNYREALKSRGVPDGKWLDDTLTRHSNDMKKQLAYDLDVASRGSDIDESNKNAYRDPADYSKFYSKLVSEYRFSELSGLNQGNVNSVAQSLNKANPKRKLGIGYRINCQRCVPVYELLRRGFDVSALPKPGINNSVWTGMECFVGAESYGWPYHNGLSKSALLGELSGLPEGARCGVFVLWDNGRKAHTFVCEIIDGKPHFFDPQTDENDCSEYLDKSFNGCSLGYYRMDNLELSGIVDWSSVASC